MSTPYQEIVEYFTENKSLVPIPSADPAERDKYIVDFDKFLKDAINKEDYKQAASLTMSGVTNLQTIALAFIALAGSLLQFGFTQGLTWKSPSAIALAAAGMFSVLSLFFGFHVIGKTVRHVYTSQVSNSNPWDTRGLVGRSSPECWKKLQSTFGALALIAFIISVGTFPTLTKGNAPSSLGSQAVSINAWTKLKLVSGPMTVDIGNTDSSKGASIRIEF